MGFIISLNKKINEKVKVKKPLGRESIKLIPRQINKCNGYCNMRPIFSLLNSNIENAIPFRTLSTKNIITTFIVDQQVKKTPAVGLTCLKCLSV